MLPSLNIYIGTISPSSHQSSLPLTQVLINYLLGEGEPCRGWVGGVCMSVCVYACTPKQVSLEVPGHLWLQQSTLEGVLA